MSMEKEVNPLRSAKEQFDRQATHYNAQWNAWSEETLNWLIDKADGQATDDVLDVATGTGFTALAFAPHVRSVIGLDVSSGMLAQARQRAQQHGLANVTFQEGPAEAFPLADEAFDIVVCRIAAHHFLDVRKFAAETERVLKPGGRLLLADTSVPDGEDEAANWQNEVEALRDPSHIRNHTPSEWRQIVEAVGLRIEEISDTGTGITIPLEEWMVKAGCTPEQSHQVRERFENAPESARRIFQIERFANNHTVFTWKRVVLKAVKP